MSQRRAFLADQKRSQLRKLGKYSKITPERMLNLGLFKRNPALLKSTFDHLRERASLGVRSPPKQSGAKPSFHSPHVQVQ